MKDFITTFKNITEYNAWKASGRYIEPNATYISNTEEVITSPLSDYLGQYLTFEALESGTFTLEIGSGIGTSLLTSVSYSTNNGSTWTTVNNEDNNTVTITTPNIPRGNRVLWKGIGTAMSTATTGTGAAARPAACSRFTSTGEFNVFGNIMSLLYGDNFDNQTSFPSGSSSNFALLFYCYGMDTISKIVSAENLILPAANSNYAYFRMFQSNNIITPPSELPATTLGLYCYGRMFYECTSLTEAPELLATTLANSCYYYMFYGCTSLTEAPELPATTLANSCYSYMFSGCSRLKYIKCLATDISASNCTSGWVQNVPATGTFVKVDSMSSWTTGTSGIPSGWIIYNDGEAKLYLDKSKVIIYKNYINNYELPTLYNPENLPVTYSSSDSSIISIDSSNGQIELNDYGTVTISINFTGNEIYQSKTLTYTIEYYEELPDELSGMAQYLTFEAIQDTTFTFSQNTLQYSLDNGSTWTTLVANTASPEVTAGDTIIWKQTKLVPGYNVGIGTFSATGNFKVSGNIMSLYYGDNFVGQMSLEGKTYAFYKLFENNTYLTDAKDLVLPATTLASDCYNDMFYGCTSLTKAPELPATTLAESCYSGMFYGCTSLTKAPELPATTLAPHCYAGMFRGCTSLTEAPELPATTLASECYSNMFLGCTSLTEAPVLPATTLANSCYYRMFEGCTGLTEAPVLPATTLASECYSNMFLGCTSLTEAPVLPATTLANSCYYRMFEGCTGLTEAPVLPATTLTNYCYYGIFRGCSRLKYIKCLATDISADSCTYDWVYNVSSTGTFVKADSTSWKTGINGIPNNWVSYTVSELNSLCLTFEAIQDTTFTFSQNALQYSLDNGSTWTTLAANTASPEVSAGNKIKWKQTGLTPTSSSGIGTFSATGNFKAYGNIMSLYYGDDFKGQTNLTDKQYAFYKLFYQNTKLINVSNLILPATTLVQNCYNSMFRDCTSLTTAPTTLPATSLANGCYVAMFRGCTLLTTAPELHTTTLADNCYNQMFYGCTSLTVAPELPATTLASGCYYGMFYSCTSLTAAPELPATTLATNCYREMFNGCTSLNYIKCLATDISATICTAAWVNNVAASGIFVKAALADWSSKTGTAGIPSGWTVQNAS